MDLTRNLILVIGRTGQVAHELQRSRWPAGACLQFVDREKLDLTDRERCVSIVATLRPRMVVNAAAYNAVDAAESQRELAFAVNCHGPAALASGCESVGASFIHLSSDYVFDGTKSGAYDETDPVNPLSTYGASKAAGEVAVRERLDAHVILRTSWVFSATGRNFVRTMLRFGSERDVVTVVNDQHGCPTSAAEVARAVTVVATALLDGRHDAFGTFHFSGAGATTWYGFAQEIYRGAKERDMRAPRSLMPIASDDYPSSARRPRNSALACNKIRHAFGLIARPWQLTLAECLDEIRDAAAASG